MRCAAGVVDSGNESEVFYVAIIALAVIAVILAIANVIFGILLLKQRASKGLSVLTLYLACMRIS